MDGLFAEREIEYREVLDWLVAHAGRDILVMLYTQREGATPLLRYNGTLGELGILDEGQIASDELVGVAKFYVGEALFGLNADDFVRAGSFEHLDWLEIDLKGMTMELRYGGEQNEEQV